MEPRPSLRRRSLPTRFAPRAWWLALGFWVAWYGQPAPAASEPTIGPDAAGTASGSAADGLSLAEAIGAALEGGAASQIARLEAERSHAASGEERSAYLPKASITSNAGYNSRWNDQLDAIDGEGVLRTYGLSSLGSDEGWFNVYLDQLLVDVATWQRIERAEIEAEAAELAQEEERERVALEVLQRFTDAVRHERLEALAAEHTRAVEALDVQAALHLAAGRTRPADRERIALLAEEARISRDSHRAGVRSARASLALAMGRSDGEIPDRLDASSLPALHEGDEGDVDVTASPELRVLDLRRKAEEKGIAVARAGYLPKLAVRGGYSHYGVKRYDNYPDAAQIGVNVDIPVFQGFKNEYAIEGAARSAEIARIRHRQALETKRGNVRELAGRLAAGREASALAERRAAASRERLRLAELNLRADRGSLDEVMAALGDSLRDARSAIDTPLDRVILWGQLRREAGMLARTLGDPGSADAAKSQD